MNGDNIFFWKLNDDDYDNNAWLVNRLSDNGRKYGMEIDIDRSQVMRVSRSNESLQIKVGNRELKEVDHFIYLGSLLMRNGYCAKEIKMRIVITKEIFNRKMPLLTSKINIELKKKLVSCCVWSINLYGSETWTLCLHLSMFFR